MGYAVMMLYIIGVWIQIVKLIKWVLPLFVSKQANKQTVQVSQKLGLCKLVLSILNVVLTLFKDLLFKDSN